MWTLQFDPQAAKELSKLDKSVQRTVKKYLDEVCGLNDPAERGHPLSGPLAGCHRYRVGQLRIIVKLDRGILTVLVLKLGRRDSVY